MCAATQKQPQSILPTQDLQPHTQRQGVIIDQSKDTTDIMRDHGETLNPPAGCASDGLCQPCSRVISLEGVAVAIVSEVVLNQLMGRTWADGHTAAHPHHVSLLPALLLEVAHKVATAG